MGPRERHRESPAPPEPMHAPALPLALHAPVFASPVAPAVLPCLADWGGVAPAPVPQQPCPCACGGEGSGGRWAARPARCRPPRPQPRQGKGLADGRSLLQGIERLKRRDQPRERSGSWHAVKETFGGDFSLNWLNPFTGPCCPKTPLDKDLVRQRSSLSDVASTEMTEEQSEELQSRDSVEVLGE